MLQCVCNNNLQMVKPQFIYTEDKNMDKSAQLSISTEVLEKMTERAACEIEGVKGLAKKTIDIKGALKSKSFVKAVKIESVNNALNITVFICVEADADVCAVAEAVQQNVKEKVQNLTGSAVTKVTVNVADVDFADE